MKHSVLFGVWTLGLIATGCGGGDSSEPDGRASSDAPTDDRASPDADDWCARSPDLCEDPPPRDPCDADGDGARSSDCGGSDCNDHDSVVHPGARDYPCDGVDQDCNGRDYCQPDADSDGSPACEPGETGMGCDCDDDDPSINPHAAEVPCDGIDQNCFPEDDCPDSVDADGDGSYACRPGGPTFCDCDDGNRAINPIAREIACDGVDNNCSGADCCDQDEDMDGYACRDDCDDTDQDVYPGACGFAGTWPPKDFNCDGVIDERDACDGSGPGGI